MLAGPLSPYAPFGGGAEFTGDLTETSWTACCVVGGRGPRTHVPSWGWTAEAIRGFMKVFAAGVVMKSEAEHPIPPPWVPGTLQLRGI